MKTFFLYILRLILFIILTALTQIGGIVYFISLLVSSRINTTHQLKKGLVFLVLYIFTTLLAIPKIAPLFGRERIVSSNYIKPTMYLTNLLNRNYVNPPLNDLLQNVSSKLTKTNIKISYLDANFPFYNGFPLLPHLSHNDGKKLDLSFMYQEKNGTSSNKKLATSGYGVFVKPTKTEYHQTNVCLEKGYFQYDFSKYLTLGKKNSNLEFSVKNTKRLIETILEEKSIQKIFIESHLKKRMRLNDPRIRFQGCKSVRHDDHIHIQIK